MYPRGFGKSCGARRRCYEHETQGWSFRARGPGRRSPRGGLGIPLSELVKGAMAVHFVDLDEFPVQTLQHPLLFVELLALPDQSPSVHPPPT